MLIVIQTVDGSICSDGRPVGDDGTALLGQAHGPWAERRTKLVSAHIPRVRPSVDQFTLGHDFSNLWLTARRPTYRLASSFQCCNLLSLFRKSAVPLLDYLAGRLRLMWASVPSFIHLEKPVSKEPASFTAHCVMVVMILFSWVSLLALALRLDLTVPHGLLAAADRTRRRSLP
jgi:hypothetical protein